MEELELKLRTGMGGGGAGAYRRLPGWRSLGKLDVFDTQLADGGGYWSPKLCLLEFCSGLPWFDPLSNLESPYRE